MKKGLIWLSLLAASVTGAAHAGDAEIQQSLKTLGVQKLTFSHRQWLAYKRCLLTTVCCMSQ